MKKFELGAKRSPQDDRDFLLESIYPPGEPLPQTLDLRKDLMKIRDQGNQGSCVAQAGACMKEWQEWQESEFD